MNPETLKEYLVKIGWNVDESSFNHASGKLDSFVNKYIEKTGTLGKALFGASSIVLSVLKTVNEAMGEVISTTASLDLEEEKLARRYWISEEAARSYSTALEALGESHADILNMTDEQYRRLVELNNLGKSLEAPKEANDFLLLIRDIQFEFSKLKVEIKYGTRWVTYYLGKFLGPDAQKVKQDLKNANAWIQRNLPVISEKIARFFEMFYRLGKAAFTLGKAIFNILLDIFSLFDNKLGKTAGLIGSFFLLIKSGPIGWFIAALTSLLLLIDDYMTWQRGGASAIDWSAFDDKFQNIKQDMSDIKDDLKVIFDFVGDIIDKINPEVAVLGLFKDAVSGIRSFTSLIADDFDRIAGFIDAIQNGDLFEKIKEFDFGEWFTNRTGDISDFYSNPVVNSVMPGSQNVGWLASLFNKLGNWIFGSNTNQTSYITRQQGSTTNNQNSNFNGTVNFNVNSPEEANNYYSGFMNRLNQKVPIK